MKPIRTLLCLLMLGGTLFPAAAFGLEVGDKAPAFTGESTQGTISLGDFTGKKNVVLALYFAVFTPV